MNGSDLRPWWWLAMTALLCGLLVLLGPVLTPFVVSALLAWLSDPLVGRLQRRGIGRTLAVVLVFGAMTLGLLTVLLIVVPLLERQIGYLVQQLPTYGAWLRQTALPWLEARTGLELAGYFDPARWMELLEGHWQQAGGVAATVLGGISKSGLAILGWLANLVLIPVVTFYFLRDWPGLVERVRGLLPRPLEPTVSRLAKESDEVLGGFLRGQLSVMLALGTIYTLGLWLAGIELAFLIGMGAGLISFVPYLGTFLGLGAGLIAALVQHGDWLHVLLVVAVFSAGQMLEGFVLTPWLVGDRIGMHPVAVIFAIMAGGQLFGVLGVLLALPVAAIALVVLREVHARYTSSGLYGADVMVAGGAGDSAAAVDESAEPASPESDQAHSTQDHPKQDRP